MPGVARIGDLSNHPGVLIAPVATSVLTNDRATAHIGTLHTCSRPDHNVRPVTTGITGVLVEDKPIATVGSVIACLAVVATGSDDVEAA